jgi:hypothetical protein
MSDLATFVVINTDQKQSIPEDLVDVLKKHGWMMVREDSIFVLPWERILKQNGKDVSELMMRIEEVRITLRRLRMDYSIKTMGADQVPA